MKKIKIPILQKRFLINWTFIHCFALFVNLAKIKGEYQKESYSIAGGTQEYTRYLFTGLTNESDFWPITSYSHIVNTKDTLEVKPSGSGYNIISLQVHSANYSHGLFNSYNLPEFIFYIGLAIVIIYVPKIWRDTTSD